MKIDRYVWHRNGSLLLLWWWSFCVFMTVISFLNENNFMREIFSFLGPVNTMPNKFENASFFHRFWPKTYKSFLSTLIRKKLENAKLPEKSNKIIVTSAASKCSVFKMFSVHRKTASRRLNFKFFHLGDLLEKFLFRWGIYPDSYRLVWTEGLTGKMNLRFQIYPE